MSTSEPDVPEPASDQPGRGGAGTPAGHLRASDADRAQVSDLLGRAYAEGRLTRAEHDERQDRVLTSRTFGDLVPLTTDLVAVGATAPTNEVTPSSPAFTVSPRPTEQTSETLVAVFGGATRKGRWTMRRHTHAMAVFGGITLDLSEATFDAPVVEVDGFWCFGGLDITVPAGMEVQDRTVGIFGGTDVRDLGEPVAGAPRLVITGVSLFGGVTVKGPKPPRRRRR